MPTRDYLFSLIKLVDDDFSRPNWSFRFQAYFPVVVGIFLLLIANYVYVTFIRNGIPPETILLAATLIVTADSFAISLLLTMESGARFRRIRGSAYFERLSKTGTDHLLLAVLVRMRVNLPKGVTLRNMYDFNSSAFSTEDLTRRALEPLP